MGAHTLYVLHRGEETLYVDLSGQAGSRFAIGARVRAEWTPAALEKSGPISL